MYATSINYLHFWCVVLEVVELSFNKQPVKVIIAVLEASNVSQIGLVEGGVLMKIHCPFTSAWEPIIPSTIHVALFRISFCSGLFTKAETSVSLLQASIGITSRVAKCYASRKEPCIPLDFEWIYIKASWSLLANENSHECDFTYSSGVLVVEFLMEPVMVCW